MKHLLFIAILLLGWGVGQTFAQTSFMADDGVAVFYPEHFDSAQTLPSLAVIENLQAENPVPPNWTIVPEFSMEDGKAVAKISYKGNVDLYGTGEVTGPLRRNGTKITLWNTDNYTYAKDSGQRLYQSHPWVMGVREDGSVFGILADNNWKQTLNLSNPITFTSDGPAFSGDCGGKAESRGVAQSAGQADWHHANATTVGIGISTKSLFLFPTIKGERSSWRFSKAQHAMRCCCGWILTICRISRFFTFDFGDFPASRTH